MGCRDLMGWLSQGMQQEPWFVRLSVSFHLLSGKRGRCLLCPDREAALSSGGKMIEEAGPRMQKTTQSSDTGTPGNIIILYL